VKHEDTWYFQSKNNCFAFVFILLQLPHTLTVQNQAWTLTASLDVQMHLFMCLSTGKSGRCSCLVHS